MGKRLMPGLFSSISDAELFVASLAAEEEAEPTEAVADPDNAAGVSNLANRRKQ